MEKDKIQSFLEWARSRLDSKLRLSLAQAGKLLSVTESLMEENEELKSALKVAHLGIQRSQITRDNEANRQILSETKCTPYFVAPPIFSTQSKKK